MKLFEILASKISLLKYLYKQAFKQLVKNEIKEAKITSSDKVLNLGCGSMPYTALIIAQQTKANVVAIDNDPAAVKYATDYINKKNSTVKIIHADAKNFPIKQFDVIVASHGIIPKEIILNNIYASMKKGSRLIFRNPKGIIGRIYNSQAAHFDFHTTKHIKQKKWSFRESILIKKEV